MSGLEWRNNDEMNDMKRYDIQIMWDYLLVLRQINIHIFVAIAKRLVKKLVKKLVNFTEYS